MFNQNFKKSKNNKPLYIKLKKNDQLIKDPKQKSRSNLMLLMKKNKVNLKKMKIIFYKN